jgi:cytochrome c oxidase subunit 4
LGISFPAAVFDSLTMHLRIVPKSVYFTVAACLAVLLALTVLAAEFNLGVFNTPIALTIAVAKAVLIVLFFMHVRYAPPLVRVFAAGGFLWVAILFVLTLSDFLTRR